MLIRTHEVAGTTLVTNTQGGFIFAADNWPSRVHINDALCALCGMPDRQWCYPYHEHEQDSRWLAKALSCFVRCHPAAMGGIAIANPAGLPDELGDSLLIAGGLAVLIFQRAYQASRAEAITLVHLNLAEMLNGRAV